MWHRIFTSRQVGEHTVCVETLLSFFFNVVFISWSFVRVCICSLSLICFSSKFYCTTFVPPSSIESIPLSQEFSWIFYLEWGVVWYISLRTLQRKNKEILTYTYTCGRCAYCHPIIATPLLCFSHLLEFQNSAHPDTRKKKKSLPIYIC